MMDGTAEMDPSGFPHGFARFFFFLFSVRFVFCVLFLFLGDIRPQVPQVPSATMLSLPLSLFLCSVRTSRGRPIIMLPRVVSERNEITPGFGCVMALPLLFHVGRFYVQVC